MTTTATLISASLQLLFSAQQQGSNKLGNAQFQPSLNKKLDFTTGTGANQADMVFTDERTINASSNDDIDLAGVLTDQYGNTMTIAKMVGLVIVADPTNSAVLSIGGGSNPWISSWIATGDGIKVPPGGMFVIVGPDATALGAVTASTADILRVANGAGVTAKYKIVILGRSA